MSPRCWRAQHARLMAGLCLILVVATGCRGVGGNVETIRYGREFTPDGERLRVAALQPRCGCVSLANNTQQRVWLESWFFSVPIGSTILEPRGFRRILFDWAGSENSDFYELVAYKVTKDENGQDAADKKSPGLLIRDALTEYSPLVHMNCNDTSCEFGTLNMNRVFLGTGAQTTTTTTRQRGGG